MRFAPSYSTVGVSSQLLSEGSQHGEAETLPQAIARLNSFLARMVPPETAVDEAPPDYH